jgi:hypothetical protein
MRVLALMAVAMLALSVRAVADCPYAVVEIDMAPSVIVDESGAHVLRWQGPSFIYDPITVMDLDVQVVMEKQSFTAAYTRTRATPSKSFGDFTSRHSLKPRSTQNANVQGALKIRGNGKALAEITQHLASHPPKLKMLIWAAEARERN